MDNVLVDFPSGLARVDPDIIQQYDGRADEIPGIFALMDPLPGAIEGYAWLCARFDTYVLSTAPWENPSAWCDKLLWIRRHLAESAYKRLILTHHKELNRGDYLIDDRTKNGAGAFSGEHIHFGTSRFPNWQAVIAYLSTR